MAISHHLYRVIMREYVFLILMIALSGKVWTDTQETTTPAFAIDRATSSESLKKIEFHNISNLTEAQKNDSFTIEFHIDDKHKDDKAFLDDVYTKVHKEIVDELNRKKPVSPTTESTSHGTTEDVVTTPVATTTSPLTVSTILTTTASNFGDNKRRRRREVGYVYQDGDVHLVDPEPSVEDGLLWVVVYVQIEGRDTEPDKLQQALHYLDGTGALSTAATLKLKRYYPGLPDRTPIAAEVKGGAVVNLHTLFIVVVVILLLLFVCLLIFAFCVRRRRARGTPMKEPLLTGVKEKVDDNPANHSVPHNGFGPSVPVLLDDSCTWIIPIDDFKEKTNSYGLKRKTSDERTKL